MSEFSATLSKAILATPELLKEIYSDLAKPGVKQVGKAIGGIFGLGNTVLYPIHLLNEKTSIHLKNNLEQYRKKIEDIPEEDITPVPPEIGVPIAEKLAYVSNADLADMYTSLLAKASSIVSTDQAHPGFVAMIDRLCPDEAILLKKFRGHKAIPFIEVRATHPNGSWRMLKDLAVDTSFYDQLQQPYNLPVYLTNFSALGIINIRRDTFMANKEHVYLTLKKIHEIHLNGLPKDLIGGKDSSIKSEQCQLEITPIGELFIKACFTQIKEKTASQS